MESSYIDMANKISLMLNEKINEQINEPKDNIATVEETLTELIHMDTTTQEGGIAIENLMDNMTGGNAKNNKKNNKIDNETNNEEIFNVVKKTINDNYFEGGGKDTRDSEEESETDDESNTGNDNDFYSEEESEDNSENGYASVDYYAEFLQHYNDREFKDMQTNIAGGNSEEQNDKIKIISRFPYMVRY